MEYFISFAVHRCGSSQYLDSLILKTNKVINSEKDLDNLRIMIGNETDNLPNHITIIFFKELS